MKTRPADMAGAWYPRDAAACLSFMREAPTEDPALTELVGAIAPHAGWVYSGKTALAALAPLGARHLNAELVIMFGGHLAPRDLPRVLMEGQVETPLGPIEVDAKLAQSLAMVAECELESPEEYFEDNALEVLWPFVKHYFPGAKLLAVGVPPTEAAEALGREAVHLARRLGYQDIVVIGSTDLTHYGPNYDFRPAGRGFLALDYVKKDNDPKVIQKMEALDALGVLTTARQKHNACCPGAVAAAIGAAKSLGAKKGELVRYTTSFDERPSEPEPASFVGYAGVVLGR